MQTRRFQRPWAALLLPRCWGFSPFSRLLRRRRSCREHAPLHPRLPPKGWLMLLLVVAVAVASVQLQCLLRQPPPQLLLLLPRAFHRLRPLGAAMPPPLVAPAAEAFACTYRLRAFLQQRTAANRAPLQLPLLQLAALHHRRPTCAPLLWACCLLHGLWRQCSSRAASKARLLQLAPGRERLVILRGATWCFLCEAQQQMALAAPLLPPLAVLLPRCHRSHNNHCRRCVTSQRCQRPLQPLLPSQFH